MRSISTGSHILMILGIIMVNLSCAKKDVLSTEPVFEPSTPSQTQEAPAEEPLKPVYFEYDSSSLSSEAREILQSNVTWLKANPNVKMRIEGHCDERGTAEYNRALGKRRADAVKKNLVKLGIGRSRISILSHGKEKPVQTGHDESAWSSNRRAEFVTLSQ